MRGGVIPRSTHPAIRQALASVRGHFAFVVVFLLRECSDAHRTGLHAADL